MVTDKTGGPAFPIPLNSGETYKPENHGAADGMTLRDYYAAKAMQALLARAFTKDEKDRPFVEWVTQFAFEVADAMLVERAK